MVKDAGVARLLVGDVSLADREISREQSVAAAHPVDHVLLIEHVDADVRAGGLLAEFRLIAEDGLMHWVLSRGL